ncbi:hypothetical protein BKA62DRAFT_705357 [Auriculariales sp. MPI-PUGE-AT-0066]|nr:hypothetical protein BKA62DRAFT_705357 [Auriculariales sp. MPI-PUGE-AT-0066]
MSATSDEVPNTVNIEAPRVPGDVETIEPAPAPSPKAVEPIAITSQHIPLLKTPDQCATLAPPPSWIEPVATSTKFGHIYNVTEEVWSDHLGDWVPFHAPPPIDHGGAIFILHHRRQKRASERRRKEYDCFTVVDILNMKLTLILRAACKNVEELFNSNPSFNLPMMYPHIDKLETCMQHLEEDGHEQESIEMLRSFLEVVREEYSPHKEKFNALIAEGKITSEFLWAVFKPGMRLRAPHFSTGGYIGVTLDSTSAVTGLGAFFMLNGHTLAWNGSNYSYCSWRYQMPYLWEPTSVAELPITMLTEEEYQQLTTRGRKYSEFAGLKHVHVTGTFRGSNGDIEARSCCFPSRCMLDEQTYSSGAVTQRPGAIFPPPMPPPVQMNNGCGAPINNDDGWSPAQNNWDGNNGWGAPPLRPQMRPRPPRRKRRSNGASPPVLVDGLSPNANRDQEDEEVDFTPMDTVPEEMLWLLPPLLSGYCFEKKPAEYDEKVWDRLVLDPDIKVYTSSTLLRLPMLMVSSQTIIRSIVDARGKKGALMINDWVKGKGGGLVVLLHGVAGVGKTLTAEAVAELLHRPLYVVGSGELGYKASDVEPALKTHLDLATRWNAVLLVDEADVFLEKRSTSDLMRNALVATFLRLLEYHSGMLILTTNRVKAFDEAFLSRVSVAIKYNELDITQRGRIWWQFLNFVLENAHNGTDMEQLIDPVLLKSDCLTELAMKPFNGRVIKNIVRTAQALAISSEEPLSMRHLRTVINITEKFGHDTAAVRNVDGAESALDPADEVVSMV